MFLAHLNWHDMFVPDTPLLEIFIRGSVVYLALFLLLRIVLKRQTGNLGLTDLLVIVLIADASQNSMANDYKSIPDGLLLVATIVFWDYALDWLAYHFPRLRRWIYPSPLELVRNGRIQRKNLRSELITVEEPKSHLREQGIEDLSIVKRACMEGDGEISVVKVDQEPSEKKKKRAT